MAIVAGVIEILPARIYNQGTIAEAESVPLHVFERINRIIIDKFVSGGPADFLTDDPFPGSGRTVCKYGRIKPQFFGCPGVERFTGGMLPGAGIEDTGDFRLVY